MKEEKYDFGEGEDLKLKLDANGDLYTLQGARCWVEFIHGRWYMCCTPPNPPLCQPANFVRQGEDSDA